MGANKYVKQILMDIKEKTDSNTVIIGDFNTPWTSMDTSSRPKIYKETVALNDTLHQRDLIDIFTAFHTRVAEYTFFSSAHGTFSRIDPMLGHKTSFNKFKKTEIITSIFSDHNGMKLKITRKILKNSQIYGGLRTYYLTMNVLTMR